MKQNGSGTAVRPKKPSRPPKDAVEGEIVEAGGGLADAAPELPPDQVVLFVKRDEQGNVEVIPATAGDVRPTEVQSIIALGYSAWTASRGLKLGDT